MVQHIASRKGSPPKIREKTQNRRKKAASPSGQAIISWKKIQPMRDRS